MTERRILCAARAVAFAFAAFVGGCSSTESNSNGPPGSAAGESCTKTADCQSGLVCLANTCANGPHASEADGGSDSGVEVDSAVGAADAASAGDAGPAPRVGQIGDVCQTTRDCASGLDCVPSSGGGGVCDLVSYGLTPTNKTCSGECSTATDCCDLPTGLGLSGTNDAGTYVSVNNCEDILQVMLGGNTAVCATHPTGFSNASTGCFFYQTYCNCAANTWACNSGKCVYGASCQQTAADVLGGCPSFTRTRTALNSTCDPSGLCRSAASSCSVDADCEGRPVSDEVGVTCRGGDCTCSANACYLKCAKDLDCQNGYSCDTTKKLCVVSPCTNDADCFSQLGKARARCKSGVCGIPCTVDHDCSPSGDIAGQPFNGTVCGSQGVCVPVGCASDSDCSNTSATQRLFCVAPASTNVHSAVSN